MKDLTVKQLQKIVSETVKVAMRDSMEDMMALSSESYLQSIREARKDYREGRVKRLEDVPDE